MQVVRHSANPGFSRSRAEGNALVLTLGILTMLMGLAAAQALIQQKSVQQAKFFLERKFLHRYAESGIRMAMHEIRYDLSTSPGNMGTENWDLTMDDGRDGVAGTLDEGEGDGYPTPGEREVYPQPIGPSVEGVRFAVHVFPTEFSSVQRLVGVAVKGDVIVTLEKYVKAWAPQIPSVSSLLVSPSVALDLRGEQFMIDGRDHDLSGNLTGGTDRYGLATSAGEVAGDNAANIVSQISSDNYDQVIGAGDTQPSVGEVEPVDIPQLAGQFENFKTQDLPPGAYAGVDLGDASTGDFPITHVAGNLSLSGNSTGAGVLVIDGNLKITGQFSFTGLIIVTGDVMLSGGGAQIHVLGATAVGSTFTALDDSGVTVSGTADLLYSSEAISMVQQTIDSSPEYQGVLYDEGTRLGGGKA